MPVNLEGIDPEKCRQRNRLAALRFGVETATLTFAQDVQQTPDFVRGTIPHSPEKALERINSLLPTGSKPLSMEDVYILPTMESASNRFVSDRFLFLGSSTLRNIAKEAEAGFALMNSHRTGAMSTPSELPFGRTFAGRYERFAPADPLSSGLERALLSVYMLKGQYPNGANGPSTDTIYQQIMSGIIHDVSMGLNGGSRMCDVCGYELNTEGCKHYPGTNYNVTKDQATVQRNRGVTKGLASYTLDDSHASEVSAVYDGAIPGAGFSKAYSLVKSGNISPDIARQLYSAYGNLFNKGDFGMPKFDLSDDTNDAELEENMFQRLFRRFSQESPVQANQNGGKSLLDSQLASQFQPSQTADSSESLAVQKENLALKERLQKMEAKQRHDLAKVVVEEFLSDGHLHDSGEPAAHALAVMLGAVGEPLPESVEYTDNLGVTKRLSPTDLLKEVLYNTPQHDLLTDHDLSSEDLKGAILLPSSNQTEDLVLKEALEDVANEVGKANRK